MQAWQESSRQPKQYASRSTQNPDRCLADDEEKQDIARQRDAQRDQKPLEHTAAPVALVGIPAIGIIRHGHIPDGSNGKAWSGRTISIRAGMSSCFANSGVIPLAIQ